jgi:hypothetical protein
MLEGKGEGITRPSLEEDEAQFYTSFCIVRQSRRLGLPDEFTSYHEGILQGLGIEPEKVVHLPLEQASELIRNFEPKTAGILTPCPSSPWEREWIETEQVYLGRT